MCVCVCFHMHVSSVPCIHLHVHERDRREGDERACEEKEKLQKVKEVYTADSRSCSIYKNSKTLITRVHVCSYVHVCLSPHTSWQIPTCAR